MITCQLSPATNTFGLLALSVRDWRKNFAVNLTICSWPQYKNRCVQFHSPFFRSSPFTYFSPPLPPLFHFLRKTSYSAGPVWGETIRKSMLRFCVYHTNLTNFKTIPHIQITNTRFKRARMKECYATLTLSAWRHTPPQDGRQFGVENYRFAARQN